LARTNSSGLSITQHDYESSRAEWILRKVPNTPFLVLCSVFTSTHLANTRAADVASPGFADRAKATAWLGGDPCDVTRCAVGHGRRSGATKERTLDGARQRCPVLSRHSLTHSGTRLQLAAGTRLPADCSAGTRHTYAGQWSAACEGALHSQPLGVSAGATARAHCRLAV